jgi:hypothetical protein
VTVSMSDHDYGLLVEAVGWIEQHSSVDAPAYQHLGRLSELVDNISKCRQPNDFSEPGTFVDLRKPDREDAGVAPTKAD